MREIKFRAWIKTGNETDDFVKPMTIQQMIRSKKSTFSLAQLNDLVDFEQFTGLTDVNGEEIYEGDIVESGLKCPRIFVISWSEGDAAFVAGSQKIFYVAKRGKILGNIHENPDLLEGD